jgi:hypothetical protein
VEWRWKTWKIIFSLLMSSCECVWVCLRAGGMRWKWKPWDIITAQHKVYPFLSAQLTPQIDVGEVFSGGDFHAQNIVCVCVCANRWMEKTNYIRNIAIHLMPFPFAVCQPYIAVVHKHNTKRHTKK